MQAAWKWPSSRTRPDAAEFGRRINGGERPRPLPTDETFCRRLGERVGQPWLGPLAAVPTPAR